MNEVQIAQYVGAALKYGKVERFFLSKEFNYFGKPYYMLLDMDSGYVFSLSAADVARAGKWLEELFEEVKWDASMKRYPLPYTRETLSYQRNTVSNTFRVF